MTIRALATALAASVLLAAPASAATLLVGNTEGDDIVLVDTVAGTVSPFIAAGAGGLISPDDITIGPDGNIYVSSGTQSTGAILRFDGRTGAFLDVFATTTGLRRPYGHAFGPDGYLYVASFRSDEIMRFDAATGAFVDVFASGDGTPNGLNGPNDLHFGPDGKLYVTTQGSVADDTGAITFSQSSQILRYDIATGVGEVFADQPPPDPESFGFVSFLGLATGPDGRLWTTDFANGLRIYDYETGAFELFSTNYTGLVPSGNFIGSLAFAGDDLFVVGFDPSKGSAGSLLTYDATDPAGGFVISFRDDPALRRPIGILPVDIEVIPLPAGGVLLLSGLALLAMRRRMA